MSNSDAPDGIRPDPLESHPAGSPLDRPPIDGDALTAGPRAGGVPAYPDFDEDVTVPAVPPPPQRKPHPGFFMGLLWIAGFTTLKQVVGLAAAVVVIIGAAFIAPKSLEFMKQAGDMKAVSQSEEFAQLLIPIQLTGELATIALGWAALRFIAGRDWTRKVALRLPSAPHLLLVLLFLPAFVIAGEVAGDFARLVDDELRFYVWDYTRLFGNLDELTALIGYWPWWLGVLIIGFGPGIGEELFCRGFLGRGLVGNYGYAAGVVLTSMLFGIMHILPRQVIYAPVLGIMLHYVYITTRSLLLPMLLHALNNSLGALEAWADRTGQTPHWLTWANEARHDAGFLWVYAGAALLFIAVVLGLYLSRARLTGLDGGPPVWQPAFPGVEYPPPYTRTVVERPGAAGLTALGLGLAGFLVFAVCAMVAYSSR